MKFKHIAFLFPGQGSQFVGMGKDFADSFPIARETFEEADEILKRSLSKIIFEGGADLLTETRNSQTGIYVTSMALLRVLKKEFPTLHPQVCSGLSLGEYTALTAAGKLDFKTGLPLVQYRGEWMNQACVSHPGTMAAIFGLSNEVVEEMVTALNLEGELWVANYNCPGQLVISGTLKAVEKACAEAKNKGAKRALPLQVHGAFHSGLMKIAEEKLGEKIQSISIQESPTEVVMNVPGNYVKGEKNIRNHLIEQVTRPVRWEQGIRAMKDVDLFIEIGCGKVLTGLNRQIGVTAQTINVSKREDLESLSKALE
jgi:[acyl-carrier-protein] S-malonyltransferase